MLSADILALIKVLGDVDDTAHFRQHVLPAIVKTVAELRNAACLTNNMAELTRMIESGSLKAMLDIFADYFMTLLDREQ